MLSQLFNFHANNRHISLYMIGGRMENENFSPYGWKGGPENWSVGPLQNVYFYSSS